MPRTCGHPDASSVALSGPTTPGSAAPASTVGHRCWRACVHGRGRYASDHAKTRQRRAGRGVGTGDLHQRRHRLHRRPSRHRPRRQRPADGGRGAAGRPAGESLRLRVRWSSYPKYGRQLEVDSYITVLPATIQGIQRYLGSGLVKGIGPVFAECIMAHFGVDTLRVIEDETGRLIEVPGSARNARRRSPPCGRTEGLLNSPPIFGSCRFGPDLFVRRPVVALRLVRLFLGLHVLARAMPAGARARRGCRSARLVQRATPRHSHAPRSTTAGRRVARMRACAGTVACEILWFAKRVSAG